MTTHSVAGDRDTAGWPTYAAISAAFALVLTAIGTFWSPLANYEGTVSRQGLLSYLVVVAMIAVGLAVVFGLVVRSATPENASVRGLALALVGALSLPVFWSGLPAVLAGGAICCAMSSGAGSVRDKTTLVVSAVTLAVAVWAALAG